VSFTDKLLPSLEAIENSMMKSGRKYYMFWRGKSPPKRPRKDTSMRLVTFEKKLQYGVLKRAFY